MSMSMYPRTLMNVCAVGALAVGAAVALGGCEGAKAAAASGAQSSSSASAAQGAGSGTTGAGTAAQASSAGTAGTGSAGSGTGSVNAASAGTAACGNGQLSVQLTMPDAAAGHRSRVVLFTNTSGSSCTISGYPGAAVTDKQGKVVLDAQRSLTGYEGGAAGVTTVTLSPGGHASDVIEWLGFPTDGQDPVPANCPGVDGGSLLITPPNTTKATSFSSPSDLCAHFLVHPVVAGTSGRSQS
jgi:hypothetical protein